MTIYIIKFDFVPNYSSHTEEATFLDAVASPIDFTNSRDFELRIGKVKADRLGSPSLIMRQNERDIVIKDPANAGILQFNFKEEKFKALSSGNWLGNLTRSVNGVRRAFAEVELVVVSDVGG